MFVCIIKVELQTIIDTTKNNKLKQQQRGQSVASPRIGYGIQYNDDIIVSKKDR